MIKGLDVFRNHFAEHADKYVLIGGTACDLLFQESGQAFRATRDLDIVLIAEALTPEFGKSFWTFVQMGQYEIRQRSNGSPIFYRFQNPQNKDYPSMLELFSRKGEVFDQPSRDSTCTPIPLGDEISSLSAILLNDAYYALLENGTILINGVSLLSTDCLLLFKVRAWLDLSHRKESGENVDSRDIRKHKNDVVRLTTLLSPSLQVTLAGEVKEDITAFVAAYEQDPVNLKLLGLSGLTQADILDRLKGCYQL